MTRAAARLWWASCWVWWAATRWLPWRWAWARYDLELGWDRWRSHQLHQRMWRHYQRTGRPLVTDR